MIIKPVDVIKAVGKYKFKDKNTAVVFYLDINKKIITSHQKDYLEKLDLNVSDIFIPAFYLDAKFIIIANVMPQNYKCSVNKYQEKIVNKIIKASCFLNIVFLDYLVVSKKKYISFHESNVI
jgi:DNA repair protein RadC